MSARLCFLAVFGQLLAAVTSQDFLAEEIVLSSKTCMEQFSGVGKMQPIDLLECFETACKWPMETCITTGELVDDYPATECFKVSPECCRDLAVMTKSSSDGCGDASDTTTKSTTKSTTTRSTTRSTTKAATTTDSFVETPSPTPLPIETDTPEPTELRTPPDTETPPPTPSSSSITPPPEVETTSATESSITRTTPTTPKKALPVGYGRDWHSWCCSWAGKGECERNLKFMGPVCQESCGTVGCRVEELSKCKVSVNANAASCKTVRQGSGTPFRPGIEGRPRLKLVKPEYKAQPTRRPTPSRPIEQITNNGRSNGHSGNGYCANKRNQCKGWAAKGECDKNPFFMKIQCQRSCVSCDATYASIAGISYTSGCKDFNDLCPFWKSLGECDKNGSYMKSMCKASCGTC